MTDINKMKQSFSDLLKRSPFFLALGALGLFVALSLAYFYPAAFQGRVLFQDDGAGASGTARDVRLLKEKTGETSYWTGSLFGGMPMYQISPSYPSTQVLKKAQNLYRLQSPIPLLPGDTYLLFMMMIGFYILMRAWGYTRPLSILGALMWAFSSYFVILIDAGHIWKLLALAYIPPTIGGLVLILKRKKYLLGSLLTAFFTALQIYSNHIQMSYYFAFVMLAIVVGFGVEAYRERALGVFAKGVGYLFLAGALGVSFNATSLYHTYKYSQETMRGGSSLTVLSPSKGTDPASSSSSSGLDKEYITQWSYGKSEMLTFLIPDAKGGYSTQIGTEARDVSTEVYPFVSQQNRYWGDQPFTKGPVYVGAFVLLLAFFGIFIAKGPLKWSLLAVTLLAVFLSWGHHMMWFTELFIDYFPLYNKFRTVSSILVIPEMTLPIFAVWGLSEVIRDPKILYLERKWLGLATALTLGVALVLWAFPSLSGGFLSEAERVGFAPYLASNPSLSLVLAELEGVRVSIFRADAFRSIVILLLGLVLLWGYYRYHEKMAKGLFFLLLGILILGDLWGVDKRYLNDSKYITPKHLSDRVHALSAESQEILKDTTQYRVLNLSVSPFNDATTSYSHRSVGGYHAAKLQRYQDLIEGYLSRLDKNVLRALNTKYYIDPSVLNDSLAQGEKRGLMLRVDSLVYGSAWFVDEAREVRSADEEFVGLSQVDLSHTALLSREYFEKLPSSLLPPSQGSSIRLSHYAPNELRYRTSNANTSLAVLSEIYYPDGWKATIDGQEAEILRVDYLLRGVVVPSGAHELVLRFDPETIHTTERIAFASSALFFLLLLGFLFTQGVGLFRKFRER